VNIRCRIDDEEAEISGDKFVAAPAGVQFPAERPKFLNKSILDELMHIFRSRGIQPAFIGLRPSGDLVEGCKSLPHFHFVEDAYSLQSLCPGAIHGNFVGKQPAIKRKRTLERIEARIWRVFKTPSPQRSSLRSGFTCSISRGNAQEFSLLGFCHCLLRCEWSGLLPSAFAFGRTVTGKAKRLMKPSASFGL